MKISSFFTISRKITCFEAFICMQQASSDLHVLYVVAGAVADGVSINISYIYLYQIVPFLD